MTNRFLSFLLVATILMASGCNLSSSQENTQPSALVSLYALSPSTPLVNVFVNDANLATNVPFGSYTLYNQVAAGETDLRLQTPSLNPAHEATFTTIAGNYYSVFLIDGTGNSLKSLVVKDDLGVVNDSVHLRFFNFSPDAPAVNIYAYSDSSNRKTIWTNRAYDSLTTSGANTSFISTKPGNYNFYAIRSDGSNDTLAKFTNRNLTMSGYYTLFLEGKFKSATGDTTLQLGVRRH